MRVVARLRAELHDFAGCGQAEFHFRALEIDRTAALPRLRQNLIQLMQRFELRQHVGQFGARVGIVLTERLPHARVG